MADRPKVKDLQDGRIFCPACSTEIHFQDYEPLEIANCTTCDAPIFIPMQVKDFWLYKPLGGGGMGSVYQAVCESEGGEYAIKVLPREKNTDSELIGAITREGEIGKILGKAPNIAEVVDYGCADGEYYMASRFVEGTRLDVFISTASHLSERQALDILLQVMDAEIHIINCGYLFRDIKPENIIVVEETAQVKLFDFGLCMSLEQAANPDPADALEGSPFYLPPERIVAAAEGEHSEIYSLGMLLFHMLAGTTYFSESDIKNLLNKHVGALRVASVANRLKHCSPEIALILDKMIKRDPNQRYHHLIPLREELEALSKGADGYSLSDAGKPDPNLPPVGVGEGSGGKIGKKNSLIYLLVILFIVAVVVGAWHFMNYYAGIAQKEEARIAAANRLGIPLDVAAPKLSPQDVNKKITEEFNTLYEQRQAQFPPFNESFEKAKICKELAVSVSMVKDANYSLKQLNTMADKQIRQESERAYKKKLHPFPEEKTKALIAAAMNLEMPVTPPTKNLKKLSAEIDKEADKMGREKYSSKVLAVETMEILKKYRSYRKGERVTVQDQAGLKTSGLYKGREGNKVVVGNRKVMLSDLAASQRIKFNPVLCSNKASEMVKRLKIDFKKKRSDFKKEYIQKTGVKTFKKYGYTQEKGHWVAESDIFAKKVAEARKKFNKEQSLQKKRIQAQVKKDFNKDKFIAKHGYRKVNGKWCSEKKAIETKLKKKRDAYNKTRNKQLAKLKNDTHKEVEKKIYTENNYIYIDNSWQPAIDVLKRETTKALFQVE